MAVRTPMSTQDALWLTMDRPNNLMIIDGVMTLSENPGFDAVLDVVRNRVSGRFPVFRRRPVRSGTGWAWLDDPDFDVTRHVKRVRLKQPADVAALQRFMSEQRAKPLPKTRPMWIIFVIESVRFDDGTVGCAIVTRFHHAMADGVRLTQVMLSMCDTDEPTVEARVSRSSAGNGSGSLPVPGPVADALGVASDTAKAVGTGVAGVVDVTGRNLFGAVGQLASAVAQALADPGAAASAVPGAVAAAPGMIADLLRSGAHTVEDGVDLVIHPDRLVDALTLLGNEDNRAVNDVASVTKLLLSTNAHTVWSGQPGTTKAIAWSKPLSLADVKAIGRSQGATVNDVMMAAVAGGMQRYLKLHRGKAREVHWMVPVNLKPFAENLPEELGNYFALVMLPMPLGVKDERERIRQMHGHMERIKHSDEAVLTFGLQRTISTSPGQVQFFLTNFFANKTVGVLSNVPGPRGLLRFAGAPVQQVVGFAPCSGDQPMTATIISYDGAVTVGFATDATLVPDPQVLVELVSAEVAAMRPLARGRFGAPKAAAATPAAQPLVEADEPAETAEPTGPAGPATPTRRATAAPAPRAAAKATRRTARKATAGTATTPKAPAPATPKAPAAAAAKAPAAATPKARTTTTPKARTTTTPKTRTATASKTRTATASKAPTTRAKRATGAVPATADAKPATAVAGPADATPTPATASGSA